MKRVLKVNKIRCKHCGDIIESKHVHDYVMCSCERVAVDGGLEYARRCAMDIKHDFEELSEWEDVDEDEEYYEVDDSYDSLLSE